MNIEQPAPERSTWEKIDWIWHVAALALLGWYVLATLGQALPPNRLYLLLGLTALLAIWYTRFILTPFIVWQIYHKRRLPYFILGFLLWGFLVALDQNALMLTGLFLPLILSRFPLRWALTIIACLALSILLIVFVVP